jgi:4-hydroxy-tetrahydrodipicolinate synthase
MRLPRGIVPVLQTPFEAGGAVDFASLARLIESALAGGAVGFLAPAVASEVSTLSSAERRQLVQFAVNHIAARVPLIAGCSAPSPEMCAEHARAAEAAGASAILIAPPDSLRGEVDGLIGFFRIATAPTGLPLIVQDLDWTGAGLPLDAIAQLREALPQFRGIKIECVPAGPKYTQVRKQFGSSFHISGGWAIGQMIEAMDRGVDALIPEASMVAVYDRIWNLYHAGQRAAAVALFRRLLPVLAFTNQEILLSIVFFKRLLVRKQIFSQARMRLAGGAWDETTERIAEELISLYLDLERESSGSGSKS